MWKRGSQDEIYNKHKCSFSKMSKIHRRYHYAIQSYILFQKLKRLHTLHAVSFQLSSKFPKQQQEQKNATNQPTHASWTWTGHPWGLQSLYTMNKWKRKVLFSVTRNIQSAGQPHSSFIWICTLLGATIRHKTTIATSILSTSTQ